MAWIPQDHVLLLRPPFEDVEHPVQPPFFPLLAHVRPDVVPVDLWRLGHHADRLRRVFPDMLLRARPDEVELQIRRLQLPAPQARRRHVPAVDVVVAQVCDPCDSRVEGAQHLWRVSSEGCSLREEDALFPIYAA